MKCVCVFLPAFISVAILNRRKGYKCVVDVVLSYGMWTLFLNFLNMILVTYVLRIDNVVFDSLDSFPFALKYIAVASVMAFVFPYFFEIIKKFINIEFKVDVVDEKK